MSCEGSVGWSVRPSSQSGSDPQSPSSGIGTLSFYMALEKLLSSGNKMGSSVFGVIFRTAMLKTARGVGEGGSGDAQTVGEGMVK